MSLSQGKIIFARAKKLGFAAAGVTGTANLPAAAKKQADLPANTSSFIVLAHQYPPFSLGEVYSGDVNIYLAQYSRGYDYHDHLKNKLKSLTKQISSVLGAKHHWYGVDNHPLSEKSLAQQAGLGFLGKNNLLIIPGLGSLYFLALVASPLKLKYLVKTPAQIFFAGNNNKAIELDNSSSCQGCNKCIQVCPGNALNINGSFCKENCRSYLTQQRGILSLSQLKIIANNFWGCDDCQLVCPHNIYNYNANYYDSTIRNYSKNNWPLPGKLFPADFLNIAHNNSISSKLADYPFSWRGARILLRNFLINLAHDKAYNYLSQIIKISENNSPIIRYYCGYYFYNLALEGRPVAYQELKKLYIQESDNNCREELQKLLRKLSTEERSQ